MKIRLDETAISRFHNELQVLRPWVAGLYFLYRQVRLMERHVASDRNAQRSGDDQRESAPEGLVFGNLSCCFQWYAVTLCNFIELIGTIGWELDSSRQPPRQYVKEAIPAVLEYRNKVGAHLGRTRKKDANAAQQWASLLPPSTLMNGRFVAGAYKTLLRRSGNVTTGRTEPWSLTQTHERLAERFWPNLKPL